VSAYLITGRGGSGKSAIFEELKSRGLTAFDADHVPGLCKTIDRATGRAIEVDWSGYVDFSKIAWDWDGPILDRLIANHNPLYLCGSASNQFDFHDRFTKVFVLDLDPQTHRERLKSRASEYGKHPQMQSHLLKEQQRFVAEALSAGASRVDATLPLAKVLDTILELTDDNQ
jgi:dephospho-CoA kinase